MARESLIGFSYRVLVCGSRRFPYEQRHFIHHIIDDHVDFYPPDEYGNILPCCCIISGGSTGVDEIAAEYARINWTTYEEYPADWKTYGRAAGPIRNQQMIDSRPDLVIAINGGVGTKDTVRRARKAGIPVVEYEIRLDKDTDKWYTIRIE